MTRKARILVLRGGAIGDFIVTLPALKALRGQWPDGEIELFGYPHVTFLAEEAGYVNAVRSLNEGMIARYFAPGAQIRDEDQQYFKSFDIVINYLHDPAHALRDNLKRCGVEVIIDHSPHVTDQHASDHFLKALESIAVYEADPVPALKRHSDHGATTPSRPWAAIHPGSGSRAKNWPLDRFVALAERIRNEKHLEPVFITADAEAEYIDNLDAVLAPFKRVHNHPLPELARLLPAASCFISNDGGITHLAAAAGVPTLALFGPSDPKLWAPRGDRVEVVQAPDNTMTSITPDHVWRALEALM